MMRYMAIVVLCCCVQAAAANLHHSQGFGWATGNDGRWTDFRSWSGGVAPCNEDRAVLETFLAPDKTILKYTVDVTPEHHPVELVAFGAGATLDLTGGGSLVFGSVHAEIPCQGETISPTTSPTVAPTVAPTVVPSVAPTVAPTKGPTTTSPSISPTASPTASPTENPVPKFVNVNGVPTEQVRKSDLPPILEVETFTKIETIDEDLLTTAATASIQAQALEIIVNSLESEVSGLVSEQLLAAELVRNFTSTAAIADAQSAEAEETLLACQAAGCAQLAELTLEAAAQADIAKVFGEQKFAAAKALAAATSNVKVASANLLGLKANKATATATICDAGIRQDASCATAAADSAAANAASAVANAELSDQVALLQAQLAQLDLCQINPGASGCGTAFDDQSSSANQLGASTSTESEDDEDGLIFGLSLIPLAGIGLVFVILVLGAVWVASGGSSGGGSSDGPQSRPGAGPLVPTSAIAFENPMYAAAGDMGGIADGADDAEGLYDEPEFAGDGQTEGLYHDSAVSGGDADLNSVISDDDRDGGTAGGYIDVAEDEDEDDEDEDDEDDEDDEETDADEDDDEEEGSDESESESESESE